MSPHRVTGAWQRLRPLDPPAPADTWLVWDEARGLLAIQEPEVEGRPGRKLELTVYALEPADGEQPTRYHLQLDAPGAGTGQGPSDDPGDGARTEQERALLAELAGPDPEARVHAAGMLGKLHCRAAIQQLLVALADPEPDVRRYAADALARIGDPRARDALVPLLRDPDGWVVQWAASALHRLGESPRAHGYHGVYPLFDEAGEETLVPAVPPEG